VFWVTSVYFNIRNTLPKSGTFLLGHPVCNYPTALHFPLCCQGHDREYLKIKEINSVLLQICVIALVAEVTSRYCITAVGCFLLSYDLKHI